MTPAGTPPDGPRPWASAQVAPDEPANAWPGTTATASSDASKGRDYARPEYSRPEYTRPEYSRPDAARNYPPANVAQSPWASPTTPLTPPSSAPNRWGTYASPENAQTAGGAMGGYAGYPSGYAGYYGAPYASSAAQPAKRGGSGWARVFAGVLLMLALGLGLGAGAVFALGWNAAHNIGSATPPAGASGGNGASGGSGATVASSASSNSLEQSVETTVQAVQSSVVEITSRAGRQEAIGSGDILNANGYIVTNDHVVKGFRTFTVTLSDGTSQPAQLIGQDAADDLAVVKIAPSASLHPIAIADSSAVQLGQFAIAVGNPLALGESSSFGIVSALNRTASEAPDGPAGQMAGLIQTSAPLNPGNSGGALVNLQGQLIGMPTLGAIDPETNSTADAIGYAIPSNRVASVANQLIGSGAASNG